MNCRLFFVLSILSLVFTVSIWGQSLLPEEEAPTAIFSSRQDSPEVDLYMEGSWTSSLKGGFGFSWGTDIEGIRKISFPSFTDGLVFSQAPDITLSLWLFNKYFFELSFIDDYELNTILFGYQAEDENSFLREVRIGNTDIGSGQYALLSIPEASNDSLGAMALFKSPRTEHQIAVRFDPAEKMKKSFVGKNAIDETRAGVADYIEGAYFILPDDDVKDLKVYVEDTLAGSTYYREVTAENAVISSKEGYVFFREPQYTKIAVHYTKNGKDVGDPSLGKDFLAGDSDGLSNDTGKIDTTFRDDFSFSTDKYLGILLDSLKTTINGETALLIYQPGQFSPFQMLNVYTLPYSIPETNGDFKILLADKNISTGEEQIFKPALGDKEIMIYPKTSSSLRNPGIRYPFAESLPADCHIYEPDKLTEGSPPDKELIFVKYTPSASWSLGDNVLDGSVEMYINGKQTTGFSFDPESGICTPLIPPAADDRVDFYYRTKAAGGRGGDIIAGIGNHFDISDKLSAEIGTGLRWNISGGKYTETQNEAPGHMEASASMDYAGDNLKFNISSKIGFYNYNTTGIFRLLGMNTGGYPIPVSSGMLYPAGVPGNTAENISLGLAGLSGKRGRLYYRDYHLYDSLNQAFLQSYTWDLPPDHIYPYENGGAAGPYAAASGGEVEGIIAVFDYELSSGQWAGGRIPIVLGTEGIDLSAMTSLSLKFKLISREDSGASSGTVTTFVRIGHLGEDLDEDGYLDSETSPLEGGFSFDPVYNGDPLHMKVGGASGSTGGNGQVDSEDLNGNGVLDGEAGYAVASFTEGSDYPSPTTAWQTIQIPLTPEIRSKLTSTTGIEIIIKENAGGTASGRLLVGEPVFEGSSMTISDTTGKTTAVEMAENSSNQTGNTLEADFPETVRLFSTTGTAAGASNRIGIISWDSSSTEWKAQTFTQPADLSHYTDLTFYLKPPPASMPVTVAFLNPGGEGLKFTFSPPDGTGTKWQKYTYNYKGGKLYLNGDEYPAAVLKNNKTAGNVQSFTISATPMAGGTLCIDEVILDTSVFGLSLETNTIFEYSRPGKIIQFGNIPVFGNLLFRNNSTLQNITNMDETISPGDTTFVTSTYLDFSLWYLMLKGRLILDKTGRDLFFSPGWSIQLPFPKGAGSIKDSYNENNSPEVKEISKSVETNIHLGPANLKGGLKSGYSESRVTQEWNLGFTFNSDVYTNQSSITFGQVNSADPYGNKTLYDNILTSYKLLLPMNTAYPDKTTSLKLSQTGHMGNQDIELNESFDTLSRGIEEIELTGTQNLQLKVPFVFASGTSNEWKLTPSYERYLSITDKTNPDGTFVADLSESLKRTASQLYYFTSIPVFEFFNLPYPGIPQNTFDADSSIFGTVVYKPVVSLDYSRNQKNNISDIFAPVSAKLSLSKAFTREGDSLRRELSVTGETETRAYNLFGNLGSYPVFSWYQTEETSTNMSFTVSGINESEMDLLLKTGQYINFILSTNKSFSCESDLSFKGPVFETTGTLIAAYSSKRPGVTPLKIPFIDPEGEGEHYFLNNEKITLSYFFKGETKELNTTLTFRHSTDLVIGEKGKTSAFGAVGWNQKEAAKEPDKITQYSIGIEAGILAEFRF